MATNRFMEMIGVNFDKIKSIFQSKIGKSGYLFDEDVFLDTIIKCNQKLSAETFEDRQFIAYLWTAFKNNTLRELNYFRNKGDDVFPEDLLIEPEDKTLFYEVSKLIIDNFGEAIYKLFLLHANGATYEDLDKISDIPDLKNKFRKVREFVREELKEVLD